MIISIDPGTNTTGVAVWTDGDLSFVAEIAGRSKFWENRVNEIVREVDLLRQSTPKAKLVIELPQIYPRTKSKGDPNDLIQLTVLVGAIYGVFGMTGTLAKPREWKGQRPKEVCKRISTAALAPRELEKMRGIGLDGWDAVGIGLWELGRAFR